MTLRIRFLSLILACYLSTACAQQANGRPHLTQIPMDAAFAIIAPLDDMNSTLQLRVATDLTSDLLVGSRVSLELANRSENRTVVFPADYGVRLFRYDVIQGVWVEVHNNATYSIIGGEALTLPPNDPLLSITILDINPLPYIAAPVTIRATVIGNISNGGQPTPERVGAYCDFVLQ